MFVLYIAHYSAMDPQKPSPQNCSSFASSRTVSNSTGLTQNIRPKRQPLDDQHLHIGVCGVIGLRLDLARHPLPLVERLNGWTFASKSSKCRICMILLHQDPRGPIECQPRVNVYEDGAQTASCHNGKGISTMAMAWFIGTAQEWGVFMTASISWTSRKWMDNMEMRWTMKNEEFVRTFVCRKVWKHVVLIGRWARQMDAATPPGPRPLRRGHAYSKAHAGSAEYVTLAVEQKQMC